MERFESVVARHGPPTLTVFSELTRVVLSCEFANRVILRMVLVEMHEFDGVHQTLQTLPNPRIGFHIFQDVTEFLLPKDVEMIVVRRRVCDVVCDIVRVTDVKYQNGIAFILGFLGLKGVEAISKKIFKEKINGNNANS